MNFDRYRLNIFICALLISFSGYIHAEGWVTPDSHNDPGRKWQHESRSIDGSTTSYSEDRSNVVGIGKRLELFYSSPVLCSRVASLSDFGFNAVKKIHIDIRPAGGTSWVNIHAGPVTNQAWTEITFEQQTIDGIRFAFEYEISGFFFWLHEIRAYEDALQVDPPVAKTESAESVEGTHANLMGSVTEDGGQPSDYRFQWGLTANYGNDTPWILASDGKGVTDGERFSAAITGLASGAAYHYRAVLRNSNAISYGEDRVFVTNPSASSWISPTSFEDSSGAWENPAQAYDGSTSTVARYLHKIGKPLWSEPLILSRPAEVCDRVRFFAKDDLNIDAVRMEYRSAINGPWLAIYEGSFPDKQWIEKDLPNGADAVQSIRIAFKISHRNFGQFWELNELQLHSITNRWNNAAGGFQWKNPGNWSLGHVPVSGEAVVFDSSTQASCEAAPDSVAQNLNSLTVTSAYRGRIICAADFVKGFSQVLNVENGVTINGGELIFSSKIINTINGVGVTINAKSFSVGAGAVVHSDERGFPAQQGPGAGDTFSFGGSHGGRGEDNITNLEYGDPAAPVTLGSGGSRSTSAAYDPGGQLGGGAIKVNVGTGTVRIDGQLRANSSNDGFHNTGAGGSIYILCGTFEGNSTGLVQARGGNIGHAGRSPGGGGRVAVNWSNTSSFTGNYDVSGGADSQTRGQPGTLWLPAGSDLTIRAPYKVGLVAGANVFGNLVIESGAELFCHSVFLANDDFAGCELEASSITVQAGGVISADEDGFAPLGSPLASGPGGHVSGGSHGGQGGGGLVAYGDALNPVTLGSGGNKSSWPGTGTRSPRWGGGAIKLTVTGQLAVDGIIRSNGGYVGGGNNAGAGGSIWIQCDSLSGNGKLQAKGGGGSTGNGGGGRIAISYNSMASEAGLRADASGSGSAEAGSVIPGNLSLSNHPVGRTRDAFASGGNATGAQLLRFTLNPAGNTDDDAFENIEVSKLIFNLNNISGIVAADLSNIKLFVDANADGLATDEAGSITTSNTSVSINGDSGTLTLEFGSGVFALDGSNSNLILQADVSNLADGNAIRVTLPVSESNLQVTGIESGKVLALNLNNFAQLSGNGSGGSHSVSGGDITSYSIITGLNQTQGIGWSATVTALDSGLNVVNALTEVALSSTGNGTFYTDATFTTTTQTALLVNGMASIFVKDESAESILLTVTDGNGLSKTSASIQVNPTLVGSYKFTTGTVKTAGIPWAVTLTAVDAPNGTGNKVDSTAFVELASTGSALYFSDAAATQQILSVALQAGLATVYVQDNKSEVMKLLATDGAGKAGQSADITIEAAAGIASYEVTGISPRIKGQGFQETVTALDTFGNQVTSANSEVNLSNTGTAAFFSSDTYETEVTTATLQGGRATIYIKSNAFETITLTASDANGKIGTSPEITISLSIQQRIDLASDGDTLIIAPGVYHETFVVTKPLTITTDDPSYPAKPIIDGDGATFVCEIAASDVTIEGLEFKDASSDLIFCQGEFESGGVPHASTYRNLTVSNCVMHDGGADGVQFRNTFNAKVVNNLIYDVGGNGIFMDGVGDAVVKHNEVKGAGEMVRGILINWCYPATVEDNYIHDLHGAESGLYFTANWSGNHSIRNNVIANNKLRDMVSWHPFGGSALAVRKPTQDGSTTTVNVEHNSIIGNSGRGPLGVTGHAIAWDWNGAPNLTMIIKNNLTFKNSGYSFATRKDSVDYGFTPAGGIFDYNDSTEGIRQPFEQYVVGFNNMAAPPVFTADPDVYGKYVFRLAECPARGAGDDGRDMGALLNDPTGPVEENIRIQLILGATENQADDLVDENALLPSSVKVVANNPWGVIPDTVRVYLGSFFTGTGLIEIQEATGIGAAGITFVDVPLGNDGTGSTAFQIKGISASDPENDIEIKASLDSSLAASVTTVSEDLTVLVPGTYSLVTTTFKVEDGQGQLITQPAFIEVEGLGTVSNEGTLEIRDGTVINYRVLIDYSEAFGGKQVAGSTYTGTVSTINHTFIGIVESTTLLAKDQDDLSIPNALIAVEDEQGRRSGFVPAGTQIMLPLPGNYKALGKVGLIESDGSGVASVSLESGSPTLELVAPFRKVNVVARDQNGVEYPSATIKVERGTVFGPSVSGFSLDLPVGARVDVTVERHGFNGQPEEILIEPATTELTAGLRIFSVTVKDVTTQTLIPQAAWRLLFDGFEISYGANETNLTMPLGSTPLLEGFVWDSTSRITPIVDSNLDNVEIFLDVSLLDPLKIISPNWSFFSNGFIEGTRSKEIEGVTLEVLGDSGSQPIPAKLLGNTRWFGYLPLDANAAIAIRATAVNKYGQTASAELDDLVWQKVLIGTASNKLIPINSKLLLTTDAADVVGADTIDIIPGDGQATVRIALGEQVEAMYSTSGEFTAKAHVLDATGQILDIRSVTVTVVQATSLSVPFASSLKFTRSIHWDIFPASARLLVDLKSADPTLLKLSNVRDEADIQAFPNRLLADIKSYEPSGPLGSGEGGGSANYQDLSPKQKKSVLLKSRPAYALRMGGADGEGGWIPEELHSNIDEFELYSEGRVLTMFKIMKDGSYQGLTWIRMIPKILGLDVIVKAIGGSSLNYEGKGKYTIKSEDMDDETGRFSVPTTKVSGNSVCHSVDTYQKTKRVGASGLTNAPWAAALVESGLHLLKETSDESDRIEYVNGVKVREMLNLDDDGIQQFQVWDGDDADDVRSNPVRARWFSFRGRAGGSDMQGQVIVKSTYFDTNDPAAKFYGELQKNLHIPHRPLIAIVELHGATDSVKNTIGKWWLQMDVDVKKLHAPDEGDELILKEELGPEKSNFEVEWRNYQAAGWLPTSAPLPGNGLIWHEPVAMNFYHPRLRKFKPGLVALPLKDFVTIFGVLTEEKFISWDPGPQIRNWGMQGGDQYTAQTNPGSTNLFVDFGFMKGNRIGKAGVWWHGSALPAALDKKDKGLRVEAKIRPGRIVEDAYIPSKPEFSLKFDDIVRMGRLEVDGFVNKKDAKGNVLPKSTLDTRNEFPQVEFNKKEESRLVPGGNPGGIVPPPTEVWEVTIPKKATFVELTFRAPVGENVLAAVGAADKNGKTTDEIWVTFDKDAYFERLKLKPNVVWEVKKNGAKTLAKPLISTRLKVPANPEWADSKKVYIHVFKINIKPWDYKLVVWGQERYSKNETGKVHHTKRLKRWWTNYQSGDVQALPLDADPGPPWGPFLFRWAVTDQEVFNVNLIDLDVDSDNEDLFANPDENQIEDQIEDDKTKPGKIICVNVSDVDEDLVPGFADGFDADGAAGNDDDDDDPGTKFVPLVLKISKPELFTGLKFEYNESDPALVKSKQQVGPGPDVHTIYPRPAGNIRIWTKNATTRNKKSILADGDFIPASTKNNPNLIPLKALKLDKNKRIVLWVEGINPSAVEGDVQVKVIGVLKAGGAGGNPPNPNTVRAFDAVRFTVLDIDEDVDSDNDEVYAVPAQDEFEDAIENLDEDDNGESLYGKCVPLNDNDDDNDSIPDFADFNNPNEKFVPMVLKIPTSVDILKSTITFQYKDSDPSKTAVGGAGFVKAPGVLRVWTVAGNVIRNPANAPKGHFVKSAKFKPASLGFTPAIRTVTLFIEGIRLSEKEKITVTLTRDDLPDAIPCEDIVQVSISALDLDIDSDNNNGVKVPDQSDEEDQIEDKEKDEDGEPLPGKIICVNTDNADGDEIPDYADWDVSPILPGVDRDTAKFVPLILDIPVKIDLEEIEGVKFSYPASDPDLAKPETDDDGNRIYPRPAIGNIRIWFANGDEFRDPASILDGGDFIPSSEIDPDNPGQGSIPLEDLINGGSRKIYLYVEGINQSGELSDVRIVATLIPKKGAKQILSDLEDAVRCTVLEMNLGIDSANRFGYGDPALDQLEESIEADYSAERKLVLLNYDDNDVDGIDDRLDGYNADNVSGNEDDINTDEKFVRIKVQVSKLAVESDMKFRFVYDASKPVGTLDEIKGTLRIWNKAGNVQRASAGLEDGGDFIESGKWYDWSKLDFDEFTTATLYIERVESGFSGEGDMQQKSLVSLEFSTDGENSVPIKKDEILIGDIDWPFDRIFQTEIRSEKWKLNFPFEAASDWYVKMEIGQSLIVPLKKGQLTPLILEDGQLSFEEDNLRFLGISNGVGTTPVFLHLGDTSSSEPIEFGIVGKSIRMLQVVDGPPRPASIDTEYGLLGHDGTLVADTYRIESEGSSVGDEESENPLDLDYSLFTWTSIKDSEGFIYTNVKEPISGKGEVKIQGWRPGINLIRAELKGTNILVGEWPIRCHDPVVHFPHIGQVSAALDRIENGTDVIHAPIADMSSLPGFKITNAKGRFHPVSNTFRVLHDHHRRGQYVFTQFSNPQRPLALDDEQVPGTGPDETLGLFWWSTDASIAITKNMAVTILNKGNWDFNRVHHKGPELNLYARLQKFDNEQFAETGKNNSELALKIKTTARQYLDTALLSILKQGATIKYNADKYVEYVADGTKISLVNLAPGRNMARTSWGPPNWYTADFIRSRRLRDIFEGSGAFGWKLAHPYTKDVLEHMLVDRFDLALGLMIQLESFGNTYKQSRFQIGIAVNGNGKITTRRKVRVVPIKRFEGEPARLTWYTGWAFVGGNRYQRWAGENLYERNSLFNQIGEKNENGLISITSSTKFSDNLSYLLEFNLLPDSEIYGIERAFHLTIDEIWTLQGVFGELKTLSGWQEWEDALQPKTGKWAQDDSVGQLGVAFLWMGTWFGLDNMFTATVGRDFITAEGVTLTEQIMAGAFAAMDIIDIAIPIAKIGGRVVIGGARSMAKNFGNKALKAGVKGWGDRALSYSADILEREAMDLGKDLAKRVTKRLADGSEAVFKKGSRKFEKEIFEDTADNILGHEMAGRTATTNSSITPDLPMSNKVDGFHQGNHLTPDPSDAGKVTRNVSELKQIVRDLRSGPDADFWTKDKVRELFDNSCFAAGTLILTEKGAKPIEQVRVGDRVWSRCETGNTPAMINRVSSTSKSTSNHMRTITFLRASKNHVSATNSLDLSENKIVNIISNIALEGELIIQTTDEHPFYEDERGWVSARILQPRSVVVGSGGGRWICESNVRKEVPNGITVYNLSVEGTKTYFVGKSGIWVHNLCNTVEKFKKFLTVSGRKIPKTDGELYKLYYKEVLRKKIQGVEIKLVGFTRGNISRNTRRVYKAKGLPFPKRPSEAHHVCPHQLEENFFKAKINIHDPIYSVGLPRGVHNLKFTRTGKKLGGHLKYNSEWSNWFAKNPNPTKAKVIEFGKKMAKKWDFAHRLPPWSPFR